MTVWARPQLGGSEWCISVTDSSADPELPDNQGLCIRQAQSIFINTDEVGERGYDSVRFHEEFHAVGYESGALYAVQQFLGVDAEKMDVLDEFLTRTWGQAMFTYLKSNGYLKYEQLPTTDIDARKDPLRPGLPSPVCGQEGVEPDVEGGSGPQA